MPYASSLVAAGKVVVSILIDCVLRGITSIAADAFFVSSAMLVAVTATLAVWLTDGAVNTPAFEMLPALTDQTTAVFEVPVTVASNCRDCPDGIIQLEGEIETFTKELTLLSTLISADKSAKRPSASRANNSKCAAPDDRGVPVISPDVELRRSPPGRLPLTIRNEKGASPPFSENDPL
jgi:hypothetical protein